MLKKYFLISLLFSFSGVLVSSDQAGPADPQQVEVDLADSLGLSDDESFNLDEVPLSDVLDYFGYYVINNPEERLKSNISGEELDADMAEEGSKSEQQLFDDMSNRACGFSKVLSRIYSVAAPQADGVALSSLSEALNRRTLTQNISTALEDYINSLSNIEIQDYSLLKNDFNQKVFDLLNVRSSRDVAEVVSVKIVSDSENSAQSFVDLLRYAVNGHVTKLFGGNYQKDWFKAASLAAEKILFGKVKNVLDVYDIPTINETVAQLQEEEKDILAASSASPAEKYNTKERKKKVGRVKSFSDTSKKKGDDDAGSAY